MPHLVVGGHIYVTLCHSKTLSLRGCDSRFLLQINLRPNSLPENVSRLSLVSHNIEDTKPGTFGFFTEY